MPNSDITKQRPNPLPDGPWAVAMTWRDLLFAHWAIDAALIKPLLPEQLELDHFEGKAYVGVVPFRMDGVRKALLPPIPGLSAFPEINVRTYVKAGTTSGVFFFSLDTSSKLAVSHGQKSYGLPYHNAWIAVGQDNGWHTYSSVRNEPGAAPAQFKARYRPTGEPGRTSRGTLEDWLVERYCLFTTIPGSGLVRVPVHHKPWSIQPAEAEIEINTMGEPMGFDLGKDKPILHFSAELKTNSWPPKPI